MLRSKSGRLRPRRPNPMTDLPIAISFSPQQLDAKRLAVQRTRAYLERFLPVSTQEAADKAQQFATALAQEIDAIELMRTGATKPLLESKRTVDGWFKPITDDMKALREQLLRSVATWIEAEKARHALAMQEAAVAHSAGDEEKRNTALAVVNEAAAAKKPKGVSYKQKWVAVVVDPDKVPREFCSPDVRKLAQYAAGCEGEPAPVEGVRFESFCEVRGARR